jgi:hypothetical protein
MLKKLILIDQLRLSPLFIILISSSPAYSRGKKNLFNSYMPVTKLYSSLDIYSAWLSLCD